MEAEVSSLVIGGGLLALAAWPTRAEACTLYGTRLPIVFIPECSGGEGLPYPNVC
jgi:hypothetical protein